MNSTALRVLVFEKGEDEDRTKLCTLASRTGDELQVRRSLDVENYPPEIVKVENRSSGDVGALFDETTREEEAGAARLRLMVTTVTEMRSFMHERSALGRLVPRGVDGVSVVEIFREQLFDHFDLSSPPGRGGGTLQSLAAAKFWPVQHANDLFEIFQRHNFWKLLSTPIFLVFQFRRPESVRRLGVAILPNSNLAVLEKDMELSSSARAASASPARSVSRLVRDVAALLSALALLRDGHNSSLLCSYFGRHALFGPLNPGVSLFVFLHNHTSPIIIRFIFSFLSSFCGIQVFSFAPTKVRLADQVHSIVPTEVPHTDQVRLTTNVPHTDQVHLTTETRKDLRMTQCLEDYSKRLRDVYAKFEKSSVDWNARMLSLEKKSAELMRLLESVDDAGAAADLRQKLIDQTAALEALRSTLE